MKVQKMTTWLIEHDGDWYHRWSKFDWEKCEDGVWKFISPEHREVMEQLFKENKYRDWETDRKSTRLNSSHRSLSRMPSSA